MINGGLGIGDLVRAAKHAYVRAAMTMVAPAGARVNASRLSVITGLTRKEVTSIVNQIKGVEPPDCADVREQRALRVLRGWELDPRFLNAKGMPAGLPIKGERRSFSSLVRIYGGDVTPNSVLKELERLNAVTFTRKRGLRIRLTRIGSQTAKHMANLARLLPDFASTVTLQHPTNGRPLFFGFRESFVESSDQAEQFQQTFSTRATLVLKGVDQWIASQVRANGIRMPSSTQKCRVGIGVYLVQSDGERGDLTLRTRSMRGLPTMSVHGQSELRGRSIRSSPPSTPSSKSSPHCS